MGGSHPVSSAWQGRGATDRDGARGGRLIDAVAAAYRDEFARSVAILGRVLSDLDLAEDAVQEAFATAIERWPRNGIPAKPGGWIIATARNRAIDRIRRDRSLARKAELLERLAAMPPADGEESGWS